jgi:polysaccharide biosynthesis protein PslG
MIRIRLLVAACLAAAALAVPASANAAPLLGFNDTFSIHDTDRSIALSQQFGVTTNRLFVRWDYIEATQGHDDWTVTDRQYNSLLAAGQHPLWVVNGTPSWAQAPGCTGPTHCPQAPAYDGAYQDFLRRFAARYPQSQAIEIGNEPNLNGSWDEPNPFRYAQLLKLGYDGVKSAAPQIPVLIGGITPGAVSGNGVEATAFLNALYSFGAKDYSDGIGYHVYVAGQVSDVAPDIKKAMEQAIAVRNRYGDDGKFWITETGFPSAGKSQYSDAIFDEPTQGQRIAISYRVFKSMPEVGAIYYFRLTDNPAGNTLEQTMGLFHFDGTPKPAVQALRDALADPLAWPSFTMSVSGPRTVRWNTPFTVTAAGYGGSAPVRYEWLLKRPAGNWSLPIATTTVPRVTLRYTKASDYTIGVRLVTDLDTYTSSDGYTVRVEAKVKPGKAPATQPKYRIYTVKRADVKKGLAGLAKRFNVKGGVKALAKLNKLKTSAKLKPGQRIKLPR